MKGGRSSRITSLKFTYRKTEVPCRVGGEAKHENLVSKELMHGDQISTVRRWQRKNGPFSHCLRVYDECMGINLVCYLFTESWFQTCAVIKVNWNSFLEERTDDADIFRASALRHSPRSRDNLNARNNSFFISSRLKLSSYQLLPNFRLGLSGLQNPTVQPPPASPPRRHHSFFLNWRYIWYLVTESECISDMSGRSTVTWKAL